eukprot:c556_g1_i1.p1 GENE.c556_g1_i1~~c556_g1_i1.p1  ORF type:complete len:297 (-),score=82.91 c556_g1_i1:90-851(-)
MDAAQAELVRQQEEAMRARQAAEAEQKRLMEEARLQRQREFEQRRKEDRIRAEQEEARRQEEERQNIARAAAKAKERAEKTLSQRNLLPATPAPAPAKPAAAAAPAPTNATGNESMSKDAVKSMWENRMQEESRKLEKNPFSEKFNKEATKIDKNSAEYGRPPPGSLTEARAKKAAEWVDNEIDKLIRVISDKGSKVNGKPTITFGELFIIYQDISDTLVGIMIRAKRRNRLLFEGDMLWQGVHDAVAVTVVG